MGSVKLKPDRQGCCTAGDGPARLRLRGAHASGHSRDRADASAGVVASGRAVRRGKGGGSREMNVRATLTITGIGNTPAKTERGAVFVRSPQPSYTNLCTRYHPFP